MCSCTTAASASRSSRAIRPSRHRGAGLHALSPMLVTDTGGALTHLVGAMGGDAQPQIIVQLLARLLLAGHDPATAIQQAPRLRPSTRPRPGRSACGGARI